MKNISRILCTTFVASIVSMAAYSSFAQSSSSGAGTSGAAGGGGTNSTSPIATSPGTSGVGNSTSPGGGTMSTMSGAKSNNIWDTENTYWRNSYPSRPYYNKSKNYTTYEPAYRYGVDLYNKNPNTKYENLNQAQLKADWEKAHGSSTLTWEQAQDAVRDSYNRLYQINNKN